MPNSTSPQPEGRRPRWGRWLFGMICFLVLAGLVRLGYPGYRSRQIIAALTEKGINVETDPVFGYEYPEWINSRLDRVFIQSVHITEIGDQLSDDDLKSIGELFSLTYDGFETRASCDLMFSGSLISDRGLAHLEGLRQVTRLRLGTDLISDAGLHRLRGLSNLTLLEIRGPQITDRGLSHLTGLANLETLSLRSSAMTDAGLDHLIKLGQLSYLDLSANEITDAGLAKLAAIPHLELLELMGTRITDAGLESLLKLSQLRALNLNGTKLTDTAVPILMRFTNLKLLSLEDTGITRTGIARLQAAFPNLEMGWIERCW